MRRSLRLCLDAVRLTEYDENGFLGIQVDAFGTTEEPAGVPPVEVMHLGGMLHRPLDPDLDGSGEMTIGAHCLTLYEGSEWLSIPLGDPRAVPGLAQLKKGETVVYGPAANFCRFHEDGSISICTTTDGTFDGENIAATIGPEGFDFFGPWGRLSVNERGLVYVSQSGARLQVGAISGLPAPLDALSSYFKLQAGMGLLEASSVQIGKGSFEPVSKALALLVVLAAQSAADAAQATADGSQSAANAATAAALVAIQGVLVAVNPTAAVASAAPVTAASTALGATTATMAAAAAALTAAVAAIAAGAVTIPAVSTQVA